MEKDLIIRYNFQLRTSSPICYEGINIYPVTFRHYENYKSFISCLTYNPIYCKDKSINSLPRLYFLTECLKYTQDEKITMTESFREQKVRIVQLYGILGLVLGEDQSFDFYKNNVGHYALQIRNKKSPDKSILINAKKFEDIRKIILMQNNTVYNDEYIHPDIIRYIESQKLIESKKEDKNVFETTEDKVEALMLKFGQPDTAFIDNLTIRRVERLISKIVDEGLYNAQITGSMSGFVKFKESPTHWMSTKIPTTDFDKYLKELK